MATKISIRSDILMVKTSNWNNSQQQTQIQGTEMNVKGNGNYVGIDQEQTSGIGVKKYPGDDNNGNGNRYDSIQPGQANPSCKVICLTILK